MKPVLMLLLHAGCMQIHFPSAESFLHSLIPSLSPLSLIIAPPQSLSLASAGPGNAAASAGGAASVHDAEHKCIFPAPSAWFLRRGAAPSRRVSQGHTTAPQSCPRVPGPCCLASFGGDTWPQLDGGGRAMKAQRLQYAEYAEYRQ
jgi:hypothetical protein